MAPAPHHVAHGYRLGVTKNQSDHRPANHIIMAFPDLSTLPSKECVAVLADFRKYAERQPEFTVELGEKVLDAGYAKKMGDECEFVVEGPHVSLDGPVKDRGAGEGAALKDL